MKRQSIRRQPIIGLFLVLVAGLFFASNALAQADIITKISVDVAACTASFTTTNCRNGKMPNGDICVKKGPGTTPTMIFQFETPFPTGSKIKQMDIGLNLDGSCPNNVDEDFPDFTYPDCAYTLASPAPSLQTQNKNKYERVWFYALTLELPGCTGDVVIHPLIENGGGN